MKKIVIATMLVLLLVSTAATTVLAKPQDPTPNHNEKNCWGQGVRRDATQGLVGDIAKDLAHSDNKPGAAADLHDIKVEWCPCDYPPPFEP